MNTPGNYCKKHDYILLEQTGVTEHASSATDFIFVLFGTEFKSLEQEITPLFLPLRKVAHFCSPMLSGSKC